jgi:hypothetical protein
VGLAIVIDFDRKGFWGWEFFGNIWIPTAFIDLLLDLMRTMANHGFRQVPGTTAISDAMLLLKRQTWNTNRAIVIVCPTQIPTDIRDYLRQLRRRVAFRCGFFPFFWGIGIQVVVIAPGCSQIGIDPTQYLARVDNQWAIVQSIFFVDPVAHTYQAAHTWGQFATGKFQDAIFLALSRHFQPQTNDRDV